VREAHLVEEGHGGALVGDGCGDCDELAALDLALAADAPRQRRLRRGADDVEEDDGMARAESTAAAELRQE
jgi:hypothetical protein